MEADGDNKRAVLSSVRFEYACMTYLHKATKRLIQALRVLSLCQPFIAPKDWQGWDHKWAAPEAQVQWHLRTRWDVCHCSC